MRTADLSQPCIPSDNTTPMPFKDARGPPGRPPPAWPGSSRSPSPRPRFFISRRSFFGSTTLAPIFDSTRYEITVTQEGFDPDRYNGNNMSLLGKIKLMETHPMDIPTGAIAHREQDILQEVAPETMLFEA